MTLSLVTVNCRKCQLFGHAASNCGMNYRCVKCAHEHGPGNCPLEDDQPATCVNCNQNHPASYRKCPKYVEYLSRIQRNKGKAERKKTERTGNFQGYQTGATFPKLANRNGNRQVVVPNVTYSQVVQSAPPAEVEPSLSFLTNEINDLFQCDISLLMLKIRNFVPMYKNQTDPTLKQIIIIDFLAQFV